ncbi:NAD(P)H-binding protein [Nocardia spumae]|uniref:NAD(P)H-binding protein n=1 Tax=Nocardia spumae TaxID=2887190 RepID=UPI001D13CBDE|nr:NAD(P)H-binding protein [Nocardia spumae]
MIMVTGAAGGLGGAVLARLRAVGAEVVAGSSRPDGVESPVRRVDFDDVDTMTVAMTGIRTLLLVSAGFAEDDVVMRRHRQAIDAAVATGVRHIVYTSLIGAGDQLSIATPHRYTEALFAAAPVDTTILRNGLYTELFAGEVIRAVHAGHLSVPWGTGRAYPVARDDLAAAAATVVREIDADRAAGAQVRHAGAVYELGGPRAVGGAELAELAARIAGRTVEYRPTALADARAELVGFGLLPYQVGHMLSTSSVIQAGLLESSASDLPGLLGDEPSDPADVIRLAAGSLG